MSANALDPDKVRGTDAEVKPIGIDARRHRHFLVDGDTVKVYDRDDDLEHVEELDERSTTEWIWYVDEERGWDRIDMLTAGLLFGDL